MPPKTTTGILPGSPSALARTLSPNWRRSAGTGTSNTAGQVAGSTRRACPGVKAWALCDCGRDANDSSIFLPSGAGRYRRGWPASLPSRPHRPELGTATLPGRAGWRGLDKPYGRQPTLDASASPKEMRWIPNYAAAQLEVKLFLRPAAFETQCSPRRGGVAAHESVGDVGLTALDRIDDRVVLAMAGQQDRIDFVERDSVRGDEIGSDERHRIDAVDKVRQQRVPGTADDQAVEAAVHRRVSLLVGQFDATFGEDRVPFHEDLAERGD